MKVIISLLSAIVFANTGVFASNPDVVVPDRVQLHQKMAEQKRAGTQAIVERYGSKSESWAPILPPSPIDVTDYDLDLHLDFGAALLSGNVAITFKSVEDGLASFGLDADQNLRILAVTWVEDSHYPYDSSQNLDFTHRADRLDVELPRVLNEGEMATLLITYGGRASRLGDGVNWRSHSGTPLAHTQAEPYGARVWFPCNDRPDDKAQVSLKVTAPSEFVVSSNGLQQERKENGDGTATTTWESRYDVATYLVVMNVSNFEYQEWTYEGLDGTTMPVVAYVYPELAAQAAIDLAITPTMIEVLAERFGEYPFIDEKYGNCTTPFGGGMEHQTLTTISADAIGDPWMDWLNVHELGHQWWGDFVNNDNWKELWLNEGFATYTEWLWAEHLGGTVLADTKIEEDYRGYFLGALYDNPVAFSTTVYSKGGWVVHMLRTALGDEDFFEGIRLYREAHGEASATSEELRAAFEAASGEDLEWFFDQWVYGANRPRLQWEWTQGANPNSIDITFYQKQTNCGLFRLPVDIDVHTLASVERHRVWLEPEAEQTVTVDLEAEANQLVVDPENNLLAHIAKTSEPDLDLGPLHPYDFDAGLVTFGTTATVDVPLTNVGGADLVIEDIMHWYGSGFSIVEPTQFPITVPPGETRNLVVRFNGSPFGEAVAEFIITSNDPTNDNWTFVRVEATGAFSESPTLSGGSSLRIGNVPVGGSGEDSLYIENKGGSDLQLDAVLSGGDFVLASHIPESIPPGGYALVAVRFEPTQIGDQEGELVFQTNDPRSLEHTIRITGSGVAAPAIKVDSPVLGFGVGQDHHSLTVSNDGTADLVISSVDFSGDFEDLSNWNLPMTLAAGEEAVLEIALSSQDEGYHSGMLHLYSNDPGLPRVAIPLKAYAVDETPVRSAVAASAATGGIGGAQWFTDLILLNPGVENAAISLVFRPIESRSSTGADISFWLPAGTQRSIADVVAQGGFSGAGGLELTSDNNEVIAITRTYSVEEDGSFGQFIPAVSVDQAQQPGEGIVLPGLASGSFHSNIGVLNLGADPLDFALHLVSSDGNKIGQLDLSAQPFGYAQKNSVLAPFTTAEIRGAYATTESITGSGPFLLFASVVDDGSHDPSYIVPMAAPAASTDLVIAAMADAEGDQGTRWNSEMTIVNTGANSAILDMSCNNAGIQVQDSFELGPRESLYVEQLSCDPAETGWVGIQSDSGSIHAVSRTFNTAASGTFGQTIPAVSAATLTNTNDVILLAGLNSADGFRTNLGFTSLSDQLTVINIMVFDDQGSVIGDLEVDLPARAFTQVFRVLANELDYQGHAWARISSSSPSASYIAHASVVAGDTGDPIYIPAVRWQHAR